MVELTLLQTGIVFLTTLGVIKALEIEEKLNPYKPKKKKSSKAGKQQHQHSNSYSK